MVFEDKVSEWYDLGMVHIALFRIDSSDLICMPKLSFHRNFVS